MLKAIKQSAVKKLLPKRNPLSHKGENGRILIVGGSIEYHGAPILSALGALYSGADLVYLFVPECNFDCTRSMYPDFIVKKYHGDYLNKKAAKEIIEFGKNCDTILMGPGLTDKEEVLESVLEILKNLHIPTVLDADAIAALKKIDKFPLEQTVIATPHLNEFQNLVDKDIVIKEQDMQSIVFLRSLSMDLHVNVLLKGPVDFVSSEDGGVELNFTGNAGMTVGGSGDVLSGVVASFLAQGCDGFDAARAAAFVVGKAGDMLKKQKGYCFSASDIASALPYAIQR
ncbi:MAG: NAD(P)H-hydrate dehydratase [Candidatus Gracilibacteria bacterium]|jgi:NAD(P)H-hydrate epimerase